MAPDLTPLLSDLDDEAGALAALLGPLDEADWARPTPAAGWTVRDQIAHLLQGEDLAALAATDPPAFADRLAELIADMAAASEGALAAASTVSGAELLARWRRSVGATIAALTGRPGDERIAWITGPMAARSFVTARLMETWAHGLDIADTFGTEHPPTMRLRHIAHLGVSTRRFSFTNRGIDPGDGDVRVELTAPDGSTWVWGPAASEQRVTGSGFGFCAVVTQRRHRDDTDLRAIGAHADDWLSIAQCFAGPPTDGPAPIGVH